jgi:hypothetical protein
MAGIHRPPGTLPVATLARAASGRRFVTTSVGVPPHWLTLHPRCLRPALFRTVFRATVCRGHFLSTSPPSGQESTSHNRPRPFPFPDTHMRRHRRCDPDQDNFNTPDVPRAFQVSPPGPACRALVHLFTSPLPTNRPITPAVLSASSPTRLIAAPPPATHLSLPVVDRYTSPHLPSPPRRSFLPSAARCPSFPRYPLTYSPILPSSTVACGPVAAPPPLPRITAR